MKRHLPLILVSIALIACLAERGIHHKPTEVDALRTDQMVAVLQDSGWVVLEADRARNITENITRLEADTSRLGRQVRELARQAMIAGAEIRAITELQASAETALRLSGEVFGPVRDTLQDLPPDSVTTSFDDGVFSGRVAYYPAPQEFLVQARARIAAALAITEAADGRVLFSAIPSDPRVNLQLTAASWEPPAPVEICSLGQKAKIAGVSTVLWEGAKLIHRAWSNR